MVAALHQLSGISRFDFKPSRHNFVQFHIRQSAESSLSVVAKSQAIVMGLAEFPYMHITSIIAVLAQIPEG